MPRRNVLTAIYDLHEQWAKEYSLACRRGCATCCTRSVTMTTLEGELIRDYLVRRRPDLIDRLAELPDTVPRPAMTTNQFAAACLRGEDVAEGPGEWDLSPCVFLEEGSCTIYPVRPFMCRGFGSRVRCDGQGEAEVEPLLLTLNTIILQCIEHLDRGRPWGNMNLILREIGAADEGGEKFRATGAVAQPIPGFLLLPGEKAALQEKLQALLRLLHVERQPVKPE